MLIEILYCGVCRSDIHQARGEWGNSIDPMVPGHEIVGRFARVGAAVSRWKVGAHRRRRGLRPSDPGRDPARARGAAAVRRYHH